MQKSSDGKLGARPLQEISCTALFDCKATERPGLHLLAGLGYEQSVARLLLAGVNPISQVHSLKTLTKTSQDSQLKVYLCAIIFIGRALDFHIFASCYKFLTSLMNGAVCCQSWGDYTELLLLSGCGRPDPSALGGSQGKAAYCCIAGLSKDWFRGIHTPGWNPFWQYSCRFCCSRRSPGNCCVSGKHTASTSCTNIEHQVWNRYVMEWGQLSPMIH